MAINFEIFVRTNAIRRIMAKFAALNENQYVYTSITYIVSSFRFSFFFFFFFGLPVSSLLPFTRPRLPFYAHYVPQMNHTQTTEMSRKFSFMAPLTPFAISTILSIFHLLAFPFLPVRQLTSWHWFLFWSCYCYCLCR